MTTHPIPDVVLTDHIAILGKTGSGKTYAGKGIVERLLKQNMRVCVVDPKNAWWGLKSSADGKTPAFPIIVFGGPNADVPLLANHGQVLGEAVATTHMNCIICTKGMPEGERIKFLTAFFQTLDMKNSEPLHLVLDEAHMMAPQKPLGEMQRLTHWTSELVSGGRGMGFRVMLLDQRPARLNKDVLTQCETLVPMRMTGPQDRNAVWAWIEDQGDKETGKEIVASLPSLQSGEGWVWAPQHKILKKVKFPLITTYDNSKTKKDGKADAKANLAPVDLSALQSKLGKVKAEIDANDPKALKAEVARLKVELAKKPAAAPAADPKALESARQDGYGTGYQEGFQAGWSNGYQQGWKASFLASVSRVGAADGENPPKGSIRPPSEFPVPGAGRPPFAQKAAPATPYRTAPAPVVRRPPRGAIPGPPVTIPAGTLTRPEQKVVDAVAWWAAAGQMAPTRAQVGGVAGYSPSSGGFNNIIGGLGRVGMLEVVTPGTVSLTREGKILAHDPGSPTTEELHDRVRAILSNPQRKLFEAVIAAYPEDMSRDDLGDAVGYSPTSGGFNNLIGELTSLSVIIIPRARAVQAAGWLFLQ